MEQQNRPILSNRKSRQIAACAFSKADLKTLCERLQELNLEAAEEEIRNYFPLDRSPEQISTDRETLRQAFTVKVTVQGIDDETIFGTIPDVFNSPRFPDNVVSLYIDSAQDLNLYDWNPRNRFELFLDFSKPDIINLSLSPSISTPNASNLLVVGLNSTWVNGVYHVVTDLVKNRKTRRRFLHKHSVYDLLVICGSFPFGFSIAAKLSGFVNSLFGEHSVILKTAAYVYVFYFSLLLFRTLFDYAR